MLIPTRSSWAMGRPVVARLRTINLLTVLPKTSDTKEPEEHDAVIPETVTDGTAASAQEDTTAGK